MNVLNSIVSRQFALAVILTAEAVALAALAFPTFFFSRRPR
jgi:hypothetical protein